MRVLTIDFETYWDSKGYTLSKMSPLDYIRDDRFHAQILGACYDREDVAVYATDADIKQFLMSVNWDDTLIVAHNLDGFDALILSERYNIHPRWTLDTIVAMRWLGLSSVCAENHASLTEYLGNGTKMQGTVISDGKRWPHDFAQLEQQAFKLYCAQDVDQCRKNFFSMIPHIGKALQNVIRFASITSNMATSPVFEVDVPLLEGYQKELQDKTAAARQAIMHMFHFTSDAEFLKAIRSTVKLTDMFKHLGVEPPMALSVAKTKTARAQLVSRINEAHGMPLAAELERQLDEKEYAVYAPSFAKTNLEFLDMLDHPDERVALLAKTRLENFSSGELARCENLIRFGKSGKPLPIMLKTFAAHTSRFGAGSSEGKSAGLNVQNFRARGGSTVLRQSIHAPEGYVIVDADSSQIECRVLAYIAQEHDLLKLFHEGGDPYANLASKVRPGLTPKEIHDGAKQGNKDLYLLRTASKTCVLGAGYGIGWRKMAASMWRTNTKLDADRDVHNEKAKEIHSIYRMTHSHIVSLWNTCGGIIEALVRGVSGMFGGPDGTLFAYGPVEMAGGRIVPSIILPSGFCLRYPNLRQEVSEEDDTKLEFVYDRQRGKSLVKTRIYGGALTENITQALAFQILMWQANEMHKAGLSPAVNVHDSFGCAVTGSSAEATAQLMLKVMKTPPPWCEGLPLDAEYKIGKTFEVI